MNGFKINKIIGFGFFLFLFLMVVPILFQNEKYLINIITTASILSIVSLGVWVTFTIGRVNIGQAAFTALGAYTTAILSTKLGISFWLCLPLSGLVAAVAGLIIGLPILRLKGFYFAMVTLSITEAFRLLYLNLESITGGGNGIMGIPRPGVLTLGNLTIIPAIGRNRIGFFYLVAIVLVIVILTLWRLYKSRIGWLFKAIRQSEDLALSSGVNIVKYRVIAYTLGCFLGGIGGSLFAVFYQNIFPNSFQVNDSIYFMLYCFVGGLNVLAGPVFGAFFLTAAFESLRFIQKFQEAIYACIMILVMLYLPNGVLSIRLENLRRSIGSLFQRKPVVETILPAAEENDK